MAKKRRKTRAPQLKKNRKTGLRTLSSNESYDKYTLGNHISSSAKVGNILKHMSYASTDMVPYLVSTSSRYNALAKERSNIVGEMASSVHENFSGLIELLADGIAEDEEKVIPDFVNMLNNNKRFKSADEAIASLNDTTAIFGNMQTTISGSIDETMKSLLDVYQRFLSNPNFKEKATERIKAVHDGQRNPLTLQSDAGLGINYSKNISPTFMADFFKGVNNSLDILQSSEFFGEDVLRLEQSLSFIYGLILRTANQMEGGGISAGLFVEIDKEFKKIVREMEIKLKKKLTYKGGRYAFGFLSEVMIAYAQEKVFNKIVADSWELEEVIVTLADGITEETVMAAPKVAMQLLSGKGEGPHKSADVASTFKGQTVKFDMKQNSPATIKKYKGFVYNITSLEVDFREEYENMRDGGIPNSVFQMYRILMLNMAASRGYSLKNNPLERQMYVKNMLNDENRFIDKFMALDTEARLRGYPNMVSMNGYIYRFSDVIRQMTFENDFISDLSPDESKSVHVRDPYPIDAGQLYFEKMNIGGGKRIKGFSEAIPMMTHMVKEIEDEYFRQEERRKVLLRICLR